MPRQRRHKTRYSGVFVVDLSSGDQTFYIRFKKEGKLIEERAGRKKQGMTGAKANQLRADRMTGKSETNAEKRARLLSQAGRLRISGIWKEYLRNKGDKLKGLRTDENRYRNHILIRLDHPVLAIFLSAAKMNCCPLADQHPAPPLPCASPISLSRSCLQ